MFRLHDRTALILLVRNRTLTLEKFSDLFLTLYYNTMSSRDWRYKLIGS
jgi:hypothetical protein